MANAEHLKILKEGVAGWNRFKVIGWMVNEFNKALQKEEESNYNDKK